MTKEMMEQLVCVVVDKVKRDGDSNGTAPVTLQIGFTHDKMVIDNGIVITNAPPAVIEAVMVWVEGYRNGGQYPVTASAGHGGLLVQ